MRFLLTSAVMRIIWFNSQLRITDVKTKMSGNWTQQTMKLFALSHIKLSWTCLEVYQCMHVTAYTGRAMLRRLLDCGAPMLLTKRGLQFQYKVPICDYEHVCRNLEISSSQMDVFWQIDSTQSYLGSNPNISNNSQFCVAESQIYGRGRRENRWFCPFGCGILFSYKVRVSLSFPANVFAHVFSLQVVEWLRRFMPNTINLKWPNDIWLDQEKLMGVLVDREIYNDYAVLIIGVGCNVSYGSNARTIGAVLPEDLCGFDKTLMTSRLMQLCRHTTILLEQFSFATFVQRYNAVHKLHLRTVRFLYEKCQCIGIIQGVSTTGMLIIRDVTGRVLSLYSIEHITALRECVLLEAD